ncbi:MAG: alanine racemase [bacterium]
MNQIIVNLEALRHNLSRINTWMGRQGASWTVVTKVLCGHADTLRALHLLGVRSVGESRLENLDDMPINLDQLETWFLRVPDLSAVGDVARWADVSLNSEHEVITALNEAARKLGKIHKVIIMIELGDLREGILPGTLVDFYQRVFELDHIEVIGVGANLGCLAGVVPNVDQFMQLILYRELLELKFGHKLPLISAGSSVVLPLLLEGQLPRAINHFRIGEAIFLGTDLVNGGTLEGLRDDVYLLRAEIAEIKEKGLVAQGETGVNTPGEAEFATEAEPGQRGYRALVSVGNLDTDVTGLSPIDERLQVAGASSDIVVINVGDSDRNLKVGDHIEFKVNYPALLRLMSSRYVEKVLTPSLAEFRSHLDEPQRILEAALDVIAEQDS